jgi:hypothetical protein
MAISFNSDPLSTELKKISPSVIQGKSPKIKTAEIDNIIDKSTPQIKDKVTNSIENFKNIKTGVLPEIEIPNLDINAYTEPLNSEIGDNLVSFSEVQGKLNAERLKKDINFNAQLDSIDANKISTSELATFQGDMFENVKLGVNDISNSQLRDFNLDPANQLKAVDDITSDIVTKAKVQAEQGVANVDKVQAQTKSIDALDGLVDKKNIFV